MKKIFCSVKFLLITYVRVPIKEIQQESPNFEKDSLVNSKIFALKNHANHDVFLDKSKSCTGLDSPAKYKVKEGP